VTLRATRTGGIEIHSGLSTIGQGAETAMAQVCSDVLGIDYARVKVHAGDTGTSPFSPGAFASRGLISGAGAVREAALRIRAKTLRIAAFLLAVADPDDLEIDGDVVRHRNDRDITMTLAQVHHTAILGHTLPEGEEPGLEVTVYVEPRGSAYAYGTAAAVVSVDPGTGDFDIERFVFVHDCGTPVNPVLVEGQIHGGIAQALGAALAEELRYDPETGQLVNGSMMDYFVPTAADLPEFELGHTEVPSPLTPFGLRGVGEAGTIPPAAAVANAICDALADFGVELDELPITPEAVWSALRAADRQDAGA
jgi:carbon-monoxide dehydrogenase large subunit